MCGGAWATKRCAQDGFWPDITIWPGWTSSPTVHCPIRAWWQNNLTTFSLICFYIFCFLERSWGVKPKIQLWCGGTAGDPGPRDWSPITIMSPAPLSSPPHRMQQSRRSYIFPCQQISVISLHVGARGGFSFSHLTFYQSGTEFTQQSAIGCLEALKML